VISYKEFLSRLGTGKPVYNIAVRVPIKHLIKNEPTGYVKKAKKYANWLKKGKSKSLPAIHIVANVRRGKWRLKVINGHHRLAAHKHLKRKTIKAKLVR
jgi:hypothetical protein